MNIARLLGKTVPVSYTHIDDEGRVVGTYKDVEVRSHGALPGERANVLLTAHKKGGAIGDVQELLTQHPRRLQPKESHYTSCSPWQIMPYEMQCDTKHAMLERVHGRPLDAFTPSEHIYGYRTKIEFGLKNIQDKLHLTLHGHGCDIVTKNGCVLASDAMNQAACAIRDHLRSHHYPAQDLKSIIIRESKTTKWLCAILYVHAMHTLPTLKDIPILDGLVVAKANPAMHRSEAQEILTEEGETHGQETIAGTTIRYPFHAFFQNNIPLFEQAIRDIRSHTKGTVVELYGGTGAITIPLARTAKHIISYEKEPYMTNALQENIRMHSIRNIEARTCNAHELPRDAIQNADTLLVNPTRRGLSPTVISAIRSHLPRRIIYLACNPITQARDIRLLKKAYDTSYVTGYDFYPHTRYVESLVILTRRD